MLVTEGGSKKALRDKDLKSMRQSDAAVRTMWPGLGDLLKTRLESTHFQFIPSHPRVGRVRSSCECQTLAPASSRDDELRCGRQNEAVPR